MPVRIASCPADVTFAAALFVITALLAGRALVRCLRHVPVTFLTRAPGGRFARPVPCAAQLGAQHAQRLGDLERLPHPLDQQRRRVFALASDDTNNIIATNLQGDEALVIE